MQKKIFLFFCSVFIFLSSAIILFNKINTNIASIHSDEPGWISAGYYYTNLLLDFDFNWQKWNCAQCSTFGSLNPHVGKILLGLPLVMTSPNTFFGFYDLKISLNENKMRGNIPPAGVLIAARRSSAVWGALCCAMVFLIGYYTVNVWVGFIACMIVLFNKIFLASATIALTDNHYNFFLLSLCLAGGFFCIQRNKYIFFCCFAGFLTGLTASVKISGFLIGIVFFAVLCVYSFCFSLKRAKSILIFFVAFLLLATVTIIALNPCFWPATKTIEVHSLRDEFRTFLKQDQFSTMERQYFLKRYPQLTNLCRILGLPEMLLRWNKLLNQQQSAYMNQEWKMHRYSIIHKNIFLNWLTFPLEVLFFLIGIIICTSRFVFNRQNSRLPVLLLFFITNYLIIVLFLKVDWPRYYLPLLNAMHIISAIGIYGSACYFFRKMQEMWKGTTDLCVCRENKNAKKSISIN